MSENAHVDDGPEDRRQQLSFIQDAIARMAHASSSAKGWILPVVTAAYGFAIVGTSGTVALVGIVATVAFAYIDAHYLQQEQCFRRLYEAVSQGDERVPPYSMRWSLVMPVRDNDSAERHKERSKWQEKLRLLLARWVPEKVVWLSWSILPFYGTLALVGFGALVYAVVK
mgnify:CR=1 FL=1